MPPQLSGELAIQATGSVLSSDGCVDVSVWCVVMCYVDVVVYSLEPKKIPSLKKLSMPS
jgi:hypothetical protein